MKKEKLQEYTQIVGNHQISKELLISTLAQMEKQISRNAYMKKKFANASKCFGGSYHNDMLKFMDYRKTIHSILRSYYNSDEIKSVVASVEPENIVTVKMMMSIVELICNGTYNLIG